MRDPGPSGPLSGEPGPSGPLSGEPAAEEWAAGEALARVVGPLDAGEFRSRYWQERPFHGRGDPERFAGLFEMAGLVAAVGRQKEAGLLIRVSGDHEGDSGAASAHVPVDAADLAEAFDRGVSVCVDPLDRADERVAAFAAALRRDLAHPGGVSVKCYLSPAGYGFNTHLDAHVVTTLQIEGRKRWRFSARPGVEEPLDNAFLDERGEIRYSGRLPSEVRPWERPPVAPEAFEEVVLEPGDVLCLPAGSWHGAKAIERSLSLNVAFEPLDAWSLLGPALAAVLADRPAWRRCVPGGGDERARFLAERLGELAAAVDALDPAGPEVAAAWRAAQAGAAAGARAGLRGVVGAGGPALGSPAAQGNGRGAGVSGAAGAGGAGAGEPQGLLDYRGGVVCSLSVASLPDAVAWYERQLGLAVVRSIPEFGWAELASATAGVRIGLSEVGAPGVSGGAVVNFGVADVDAARQRLEAGGVRFEGPTTGIAGVTRLATFVDPDGNRLMLHESR